MKWKKILYIASFFVVLSCKKSDNQSIKSWEVISENVQYSEQNDKFLLKSRKFEYSFEKNELPFSKVVLLNNSLLGYFLELGQKEKIVGISGVQYVFSNEIQQLIEKNKIQNVGSDQKYDIEKILELKPDVIFTNYIETFENTYKILQDNGIKIIFLDEYLEETPLDKAAYLKLFGKLLGEEKRAEEIYAKIKNDYESIKQKAQKSPNKPKVLANEMYGNHWYVAGGKTFSANYLKDAGADYIFKENQDKKSVPISFEEVFVKSKNAEFWVNVGNYRTKKELLVMNAIYEKLDVYQKGKIFGMNKRRRGMANDIFESGAVRADLVLRDYVKIFHPEILPKDTLVYMQELK